jgi:purine-binding chemotaxis protein CheW
MAFDPRKPATPSAPERQLVLFGVGNVVYGLPIERVREVVNPQPIIELPHAPAAVVGVADHRGEVVPVIDLRARFGLPAVEDAEARRRMKWIMVDVASPVAPAGGGARPVACVVDHVLNVFPTREALRPPPPLGGGEDTRGILGVVSRGAGRGEAGLVFVLDLERLRMMTEPVHALELASGGGT